MSQESSPTAFSVVWANEFDKYAAQIYRKNFGDKELVEKDIRTVDADSLPPIDLLCAGFPCQSFSLAGKRKGFSDTRGTLFFEVARIAQATRPQLLLLENVKGLLSAQNGYCFLRILETLEELGYWYEWKVLNSKHYGVPQNRERVFIIGHLRGTGSRQVFPVEENESGFNESDETNTQTCPTIDRRVGVSTHRSPYVVEGEENSLIQVGNIDQKGHNSLWGRVYSPEGVAPNLNSGGGGLGAKTGLIIANCLDRDGYLRTGARPRDENGKPQLLPIGYRRIRRLTPMECERLQGFPDNWTRGVSDTQRYKCLGNAVTVNVIEYIGRLILGCFSQKHSGEEK